MYQFKSVIILAQTISCLNFTTLDQTYIYFKYDLVRFKQSNVLFNISNDDYRYFQAVKSSQVKLEPREVKPLFHLASHFTKAYALHSICLLEERNSAFKKHDIIEN
jgi:hypothetical protein